VFVTTFLPSSFLIPHQVFFLGEKKKLSAVCRPRAFAEPLAEGSQDGKAGMFQFSSPPSEEACEGSGCRCRYRYQRPPPHAVLTLGKTCIYTTDHMRTASATPL